MSDRPQNPNQPEHDSGFDDPTLSEYPFLKQEQDDKDGPGVNPWPLVLVIIAVGTVLTLLYIMVQALLK
jgi:hypothetical protein